MPTFRTGASVYAIQETGDGYVGVLLNTANRISYSFFGSRLPIFIAPGGINSGFSTPKTVSNRSEVALANWWEVIFGEVAEAEQEGIIHERTVVDTILIPDEKYREELHIQTDQIFMQSLLARLMEHMQRDNVLLSDVALIQAVRQLMVTDAVLLRDDRLSALDRLLIDRLLVSDVLFRTLDVVRTDQVLVVDTVLVEVITGVIERLVTDTLLLADHTIKTVEGARHDSLLLRDTRFSDLLRFLTDRVFLQDARTSERTLTATDRLLLAEAVARLREVLMREHLYLVDSATAQLIEAVVAALVYLRLRTRDLLGVTLTAADWSGARLDVASLVEAAVAGLTSLRVDARDPLGVTVTYRPSEVRH